MKELSIRDIHIKDVLATGFNLINVIEHKDWERLNKKTATFKNAIERFESNERAIDQFEKVLKDKADLLASAARKNPQLFHRHPILLLNALEDLLSGDSGCPMCDYGVLRNPNKDHWDTCKWSNALKIYKLFKSKKP